MKYTVEKDPNKNLTILTVDQTQPLNEEMLKELGTSYEEIVNEWEVSEGFVDGARASYLWGWSTKARVAPHIAKYINKNAPKLYKNITGRRKDLKEEYGTPVTVRLAGNNYGKADEEEILKHLRDHDENFKF